MPLRVHRHASLLAAGVSLRPTSCTLKDAFQGIFRIGAAINPSTFEEKDARDVAIVAGQFNTISPENVLKWEAIHPRPDTYNFDPADRYVAFGEKYKMFIVGHNLVWHSQVRNGSSRRQRRAAHARCPARAHARSHPHRGGPLQGPHRRMGRGQRSAQ
jgi:GH35 family endo-1,4-beta-xylanase